MSATSAITSRRRILGAMAAAPLATGLLAACGGSGFDSKSGGSSGSAGSGSGELTVLIGSSGDAETKAVQDAVKAWADKSGKKAKVVVASDLGQQLSQGFAAGKPADVFYLGTDQLAGYAKAGNLLAYGDKISNLKDFYPALVKAFTIDGKVYGVPKDFSTLALCINTDLWKAAGLTDKDIPTSWDQLHTVAKKLTSGKVTGLTTSNEYQRLGAFMVQAGGELVTDGKATADAKGNVDGLTFVQSMLKDGSLTYAKDLGAGWGGEAFGKGLAAMTVEGPWITGALAKDFPNVKVKYVELPAGPAGKGTLEFTNAWGIGAKSGNQADAIELVTFLSSAEQQMAFAKAFGPMPSLSNQADAYKKEFPALAAFVDAVSDAKTVPAQAGVADVISDLNSKLEQLKATDPKQILTTAQSNLTSALGA